MNERERRPDVEDRFGYIIAYSSKSHGLGENSRRELSSTIGRVRKALLFG